MSDQEEPEDERCSLSLAAALLLLKECTPSADELDELAASESVLWSAVSQIAGRLLKARREVEAAQLLYLDMERALEELRRPSTTGETT